MSTGRINVDICYDLPAFIRRMMSYELGTSLSAEPPPVGNPCQPSPCGPNSECREQNGGAACSCLLGYKGAPPACRPECVLNTDCPTHLACIGQKCLDPCEGKCGQNARCTVQQHRPVCLCNSGYTGDPFRYCSPIPKSMFIFSMHNHQAFLPIFAFIETTFTGKGENVYLNVIFTQSFCNEIAL